MFHPTKLNDQLYSESSVTLTALTDAILDAKRGIYGELKGILNPDNQSIASRAKPLIFQFPVLVTDAISLNSLSLVRIALEKQYAIFIRLASGLETVTSVKNADEVKKILAKLHVNIDDPLLKDLLSDDTDPTALIDKLSQQNQKLLTEYTPIYETKSIADIYKYGAKYNFRKMVEDGEFAVTGTNDKGEEEKAEQSQITTKLVDTEVKRSNNVEPTMMDINLLVGDSENGKVTKAKILIGIKAIAHLVRTHEVVENMVSAIVNKRFLFKLIKLTTGEISFFKDFFLNLEKNKKEAIDSARNKSSVWWRALKNRAASSRFRNFLRIARQLPPNATLVISMEEAELLKNKYDIDLFGKHKNNLRSIMQEYFLLTVAVVNEAAELVHFYFDGDDSWQMYTFAELKKEKSSGKDIQKLLSVMVGRM